jgi:menaquinone-dependent protoporphyrinogen oxidase
MARVLIVYSSRNGQTGKIARCIAASLREQGHLPQVADAAYLPKTLDLREFAAVMVGSPVIGGGYRRPVVRFVRNHRAELARMPSAFFSVGLAVLSRTSDGRAQTMRLVEKLLTRTGWRPEQVELIAGALPYTRYGPLTRWIMRKIVSRAGGDTDVTRDFEYTDWSAVDRFAVRFSEMHLPTPVALVRRPEPVRPEEITAHTMPVAAAVLRAR